MKKSLPFLDLKSQQKKIRKKIEKSIKSVLDHGQYIMGPEIKVLEKLLASYTSSKFCISCSSGTDALLMILLSYDIGKGDAIFLPSFTWTATPEVVVLLGATPIFVDVDEYSYNVSCESLQEGIKNAKKLDLRPRAIISVDLYGQPADYCKLNEIAKYNKLFLIADAAQSFGASLGKKKVGTLADATATSFFPAKPLGCYGDGGAIFTNNKELALKLESIRVHGRGKRKDDSERVGLNARLDTIQAAILIEKLKIFPEELKNREKSAGIYTEHLKELVQTPTLINEAKSSWAQYTIRLPKRVNREELIVGLKDRNIPSAVYYSKPLHLQSFYKKFPRNKNMSISENLSRSVLSLPINLYGKKSLYRKVEKVISSFVK